MTSRIRVVLVASMLVLASFLPGSTWAKPTAHGCLTGTQFASLDSTFTSQQVRDLTDAPQRVNFTAARSATSSQVYDICEGPGLIALRFQRVSGVWKLSGKKILRAVPMADAAKWTTSASVVGMGYLSRTSYGSITVGMRLSKVESMAGGRALVYSGEKSSSEVRAYSTTKDFGMVLIRTVIQDGVRHVVAKRALFPH